MAFAARESRVAIDRCVQITSHNVLNQASCADVLGASVGKLNPVVKKVISDPVDDVVNASSTLFLVARKRKLFGSLEDTAADPVVLFSSPNFTNKADAISSRHHCKSLDALSELVGVLFTEADASLFEHFGFFVKIRNNELFVFRQEAMVSRAYAVIDLIIKRLQSAKMRAVQKNTYFIE